MSYTFPSCVPVDFPASDANSAHSPPSGILRPLRSFRHWGNSPQPTVPQNHASPLVAPRKPRVAGFHPRWGTTRPCPVRGRFGPHRAQFGRKKRKQPNPEDNRQRNRRIRQLSTSHQANGFPKTRSGERCEKRAGERPGVAHRRPVPGHFARQSRAFRDFSQALISPFSGIDFGALES